MPQEQYLPLLTNSHIVDGVRSRLFDLLFFFSSCLLTFAMFGVLLFACFQEVRVHSALNHPNVVTIHGYNTVQPTSPVPNTQQTVFCILRPRPSKRSIQCSAQNTITLALCPAQHWLGPGCSTQRGTTCSPNFNRRVQGHHS